MDKGDLMEAFDVNVGGNFLMTVKFVNQPLRPTGQQLNLINVSILRTRHPKAAFTALIGRMADEHLVEDVQIISYHPGALYSGGASKSVDENPLKWDEMALPADYAVWAASPEASWLHGRFVWAHWDVDELKADKDILKRLNEEKDSLIVAVQGSTEVSMESILNK
ncbi:hypothetical protein J3R30DRAFT_3698420 [Lentinula aciculospora]|uniref:Uncharacterized protein n=1 Tax=Lentinula aciculospora TaxID=153920 RepID=A0A9W9DST9_9AGAR|nr:hypothetical protein J3R30DRAFT_3698420 [Lentinula aciculospora]